MPIVRPIHFVVNDRHRRIVPQKNIISAHPSETIRTAGVAGTFATGQAVVFARPILESTPNLAYSQSIQKNGSYEVPRIAWYQSPKTEVPQFLKLFVSRLLGEIGEPQQAAGGRNS